MINVEVPVQIKLHTAQKEIWNNLNQFNTLRAGRRFGKSKLCYILAMEEMSKGNRRVLYSAPTATDVERRYKDCARLFSQLPDARCVQNLIEWNGSELRFAGLHRDDGIRGDSYHLFIGDEWAIGDNGENRKKVWEEVVLMVLADYNGRAIFPSTPKKGTHFEHLCNKENDLWSHFHYTSYNNDFIPAPTIDMLKSEMTEAVAQQEIYAEFVSLGGNLFKVKDIRYDNFECENIFMGVDLASREKESSDFSAIAVIGINNLGSINVKYVEQKKLSFRQRIEWVKEIYKLYNVDCCLMEANGFQMDSVQELIRTTSLNIRAHTAKLDKIQRATGLQIRYEAGLVSHVKELAGSEFENQLTTFPDVSHDDMVDALVYAYMARDEYGTINVY